MGKSGCTRGRVGDGLKEVQQEEVWDSVMVRGALLDNSDFWVLC